MESLMNPTVLTRTMVVKNEGDDRCPHLGHAPVMDRDPAAAQAEVQKRRDAAMALADADAAALERKRAELKARKARGG